MGEDTLGRMIKRRRESLGFSQARLGELVGRSASTIRNWERGKSTPSSPSDAVALAAVLGLEEHRVVEAAGFEMADVDSSQTMEQAYASLAPQEAAPTPEPGTEPERKAPPREEEREIEAPAPAAEEPGRVGESVTPSRDLPADSKAGRADTSQEVSPPPDESQPRSPSPAAGPPPGDRLTAVPMEAGSKEVPRTSGEAPDSETGEVSRAAPPTVLESTPAAEPSYLEDPDERQRYRVRAIATAALVIVLLIVFLWSFDRAVDALGTMWDDFVGMLEI